MLLGSYKVEMPILCSDGAKGAQGLTIGRLAVGQSERLIVSAGADWRDGKNRSGTHAKSERKFKVVSRIDAN